MTDMHIVVSCEHAGNAVPPEYEHLFRGREDVLASHRGWDIGIVPLAERLSSAFGVALHAATVTRLLIDSNRSLRSRTLLSEFSRQLSPEEIETLLRNHYTPYRARVEEEVSQAVALGRRVLHLSVHSFTPELHGNVRRADIGLLYHPGRMPERELCRRWRDALVEVAPDLRVRLNYPYKGTSDSLVSSLHRRYAPQTYLGIELEVNQKHPVQGGEGWHRLQEMIEIVLRRHLFGASSLESGCYT